jgi:hypothetical protein
MKTAQPLAASARVVGTFVSRTEDLRRRAAFDAADT